MRGLVFPFPSRGRTMFGRLDQGVDLQYAGTAVVPIRAIAAGTLAAGQDPGGFGPSYPVLHLAKPIAGYSGVYYGHVTAIRGLIGKRVRAGQVIAYSGGHTSQGNAAGLPNWLEVGFWGPGGPVQAGAARMRQILGRARPYSQASAGARMRTPGIGKLPPPVRHRPRRAAGGRPAAPRGPRPPQHATLMARIRRPAPRRSPAPARRAPARRRILGGRAI